MRKAGVSWQGLRRAARLAVAQRAKREKVAATGPLFDSPCTAAVTIALEHEKAGAVSRDDAFGRRPARGRRTGRQRTRQRNIGPGASVAGDELCRMRRRVADHFEQVYVPR